MSPVSVSKSSLRLSLPSRNRLGALALFLLWSCVGILPAQDYFPLHVGNQWVYRTGGAPRPPQDHIVLSIDRAQIIEGEQWFLLTGLPTGSFWLRTDTTSKLWARRSESDAPALWYDFAAREGDHWSQQLPYCCGVSQITSRKAEHKGPAAEYSNLLDIRYPGVFQIGLDQELFAPYIGLVYRRQNNGGPSMSWMELVYSRTGGVTTLSAPETSFLLSVDHNALQQGLARFRFALRHTGQKPLRLDFTSSQIYDLKILNEKGDTVWLFSSTATFLAVLTSLTLDSGERNWVLQTQLPPGRYTAEAWLTTSDANAAPPRYSARIPFEIPPVR